MDAKALITKNGTVLSWDIGSVPIIHPATGHGSDARGGIPLCVPMFSTQQRTVPGAHLPLHGLLMYQDAGETVELEAGDTWHTEHHVQSSEKFAWEFSVGITVTLSQDTLTTELVIERTPDCPVELPMPLSLGYHPYFATYGSDFSYQNGHRTTHKQSIGKNIIDSAFMPYTPNTPVTLTTARGTVQMVASGFDEYCLWTDALETYFCIEPIFQYREFGLPGTGLAPGEKKVVQVALTFTPAND